ncbi:MAG: hypothetical protein CM15mP22_7320 [Gammaproteobacteria bacterium]|nr:MAG: hypothetical protein CM15mP22_7320 [Gammaproteobacteria bacterium]
MLGLQGLILLLSDAEDILKYLRSIIQEKNQLDVQKNNQLFDTPSSQNIQLELDLSHYQMVVQLKILFTIIWFFRRSIFEKFFDE